MNGRVTEKLTLHFDLSHCPAEQEFHLGVLGKKYRLTRHTPATFKYHCQRNKALALIPPERQADVTHFVEDAELPADAVGLHCVTYPNRNPGCIPELALAFIHIPNAAKRRHFRRAKKASPRSAHPTSLTHFGIDPEALTAADAAAVKLDATAMQTPFQQAEAILFAHPDLATLRQDVAATIIYDHIGLALHEDRSLPLYLSANGPGSQSPYCTIVTATNPQTGTPINPITVDENGNPIVGKDGNPIVWPQQDGQNVVQQYKLSAAVIGSADGTQPGKAFKVLSALLQSTKDDPALNGQAWSVQHGITSRQQSNVQPRLPSPGLGRSFAAVAVAAEAPAQPGFQWTLSNLTSLYGLDLYDDTLSYGPNDQGGQDLSFDVKNWANRWLGAYVRFYDEGGNQIGDDQKITDISSGNTLYGIPIWTSATTLTCSNVPETAVKADVLLGGIGVGNTDIIDERGVVFTGLFNIAIPSFLLLMSVGTLGAKSAIESAENKALLDKAVVVAQQFLGAPGAIESALSDPKALIGTFGEIAVGMIFSSALPSLAAKVAGFESAEALAEKVPIVGWAFEIVSCALGAADLLATTVEICKSPATYTIEVARTIDLQVSVSPDPTHGALGQPPIWPTESDHWEVTVQYKGGTAFKQSGPIDPVKPDKSLSLFFPKIPSAPGAQIQIAANFYSANNWLCGKWTSAWLPPVAPSGSTTLAVDGAIIEFLVPLTAQTQYTHYQKLEFQNGKHVWDRTAPPPQAVFSGNKCPDSGNVLCRLVNITINDLAYTLGYTYQASGQGLPLDFQTGAQNSQMYAFQSISVLGDPTAAMKQPTIGFSLQPFLAYDQFGPAPLFILDSATYQPELDSANGQPVPADVMTAFATATTAAAPTSGPKAGASGGYALPSGAQVTVVQASAKWQIVSSGQPLYDLRRETDSIYVFLYPNPSFSPRNFYLDTRPASPPQTSFLRQVSLGDGANTFDYSTGQSWGTFSGVTLDALVIHPNGYVIGVSYESHKMLILQLPAAAVADADAPAAVPLSGQGLREGLLKGPVALTITPDGRILVLEKDNARIQAFDTMANPVPCFAGPLSFSLDASFKADLDAATFSNGFVQAYQQSVQPQLALAFSLPSTCADDLNAGTITDDLKAQFTNAGLSLSANGPYQTLASPAGSMWLFTDQGAGLNFDIRKNLYVNLNKQELFTLPAALVADLDAGTLSAALLQEFADYGYTLSAPANLQLTVLTPGAAWQLADTAAGKNYEISVESNAYVYQGSALLFVLPAGVSGEIVDGATPPQDLMDAFAGAGRNVSASAQVNVVRPGSAWTLVDPASGVTYDINMEPDLDVFQAPKLEVDVIAPGAHWRLRDTTNTLTFDITPDANNSALLNVQQLVSTLALKDGVSTNIQYLDIGVETKGFIYVLSYEGTGAATSDYHLDIYNPDGSWLSRTPENTGDPGVNGARFVVDQWRNVYTLNYESFLGPNGRTEPSVSTWTPSTPPGTPP